MLKWVTQTFWVFNRAVTSPSFSLSFSIKHRSCFVYSRVGSSGKCSSLEQMTEKCVSSFFPDLPSSSPTWASLVWQLPHLSWFSQPISSKEANVKPLPHILACITVAGSVCGHHRSGAPLNINEQCSKRRLKGRHGKHKNRYAVWTNQIDQKSLVEQGECADEQ